MGGSRDPGLAAPDSKHKPPVPGLCRVDVIEKCTTTWFVNTTNSQNNLDTAIMFWFTSFSKYEIQFHELPKGRRK